MDLSQKLNKRIKARKKFNRRTLCKIRWQMIKDEYIIWVLLLIAMFFPVFPFERLGVGCSFLHYCPRKKLTIRYNTLYIKSFLGKIPCGGFRNEVLWLLLVTITKCHQMAQTPYIFNQLVSFLPKDYFDRLVKKYNGNAYVKNYSCWNHLLVIEIIHKLIMEQVDRGNFVLNEPPVANTWDPETSEHFRELGVKTELRDTYYTSVHYVLRPNNNPDTICCEVQVRTLFEEIWGEIDHVINYPHPTESVACKEELRVLAKLASTGTRLVDGIMKSYEEYNNAFKRV